MMASLFSIKEALTEVLSVPVLYAHDAQDSVGKGWFMQLGTASGSAKYKAYPGVYSTSFAIQLLSSDGAIANSQANLIVQGLDYLMQQFEDAQNLGQGAATHCKQAQKYGEVGHHDFVLTFKLCAVLQAANSMSAIVEINEEFGKALSRHAEALNLVASTLKSFAVCEQKGSVLLRAWPWHILDGNGGGRDIDPVPTAEVLIALTHPNLKGSMRWLIEYAEVAAYLQSVVSSENVTLLNKCVAAHALLQLGERTGQEYLDSQTKAQLTRQIAEALRNLSNVPWQEVMHYFVPSKVRTVSHYKPWIWLFPRLQYIESLCLLDVSAAANPAVRAVTDLMENIRNNHGKVIFLHAEPPTLLASLRASQLMLQFQNSVMKSIKGRALFLYERASRAIRGIGLFGLFLVLLATVYPYASLLRTSFQGVSVLQRSILMLRDTGSKLYSVWPLWLLAFAYFVAASPGSLRKRLERATFMFVEIVVLTLLVHLLATATWH
jgi:hypothetical protein